MKVEKLSLAHSCAFTLTTFEGIEHKTVCLEYTEHSTDHWNSDSETSIDLDADKAKSIIEFLHKAFPEIAPPCLPLTRDQVKDLLFEAGYVKAEESADFINGLRHGEAAHGITKGEA
jgi:hypothetical protein